MLGFLISLFLIGVLAGYLARLFVAGPDPMSFGQTVWLGVAGSFIGGTIGSLLIAKTFAIAPASLGLALPGAVVALLIYRKRKYGEIMPPRHGRTF
ncbi:MAG: GlsB/YeaQ/YmgE family stress response membrane protein [Actinomycetota bacterium]|nr:GlsB/YeaQ/YmgE family stress response membrane protein [Actinomycetota bacterium]